MRDLVLNAGRYIKYTYDTEKKRIILRLRAPQKCLKKSTVVSYNLTINDTSTACVIGGIGSSYLNIMYNVITDYSNNTNTLSNSPTTSTNTSYNNTNTTWSINSNATLYVSYNWNQQNTCHAPLTNTSLTYTLTVQNTGNSEVTIGLYNNNYNCLNGGSCTAIMNASGGGSKVTIQSNGSQAITLTQTNNGYFEFSTS